MAGAAEAGATLRSAPAPFAVSPSNKDCHGCVSTAIFAVVQPWRAKVFVVYTSMFPELAHRQLVRQVLQEPGVALDLGDADAVVGALCEQAAHQVPALRGNAPRDGVLAVQYRLRTVRDCLSTAFSDRARRSQAKDHEVCRLMKLRGLAM